MSVTGRPGTPNITCTPRSCSAWAMIWAPVRSPMVSASMCELEWFCKMVPESIIDAPYVLTTCCGPKEMFSKSRYL